MQHARAGGFESRCMKRKLTLLLKRCISECPNQPYCRLVGLLQKAGGHKGYDERSVWTINDLAAKIGCHPKRFTRLARLNYLASDILSSIRDGTQAAGLNCRTLMTADLPPISARSAKQLCVAF